ncbi:MAG: TonB-dependent receptor [Gemmatimonadales bacterium]|nr:TonB-dependent receptor [Gemmatimonadales bacterium]
MPKPTPCRAAALVLACAIPTIALAQQAPSPRVRAARDSAVADTTRLQQLKEISVSVTLSEQSLQRTPAAAAVVDQDAIRRGQATMGLDEALNSVPGVYVANRYNFAQEARISIRGAGSRAPFGTRGIRIIVDGIPQTAPDGQSQFTNLELANTGRIEVLKGAAGSLYGNASGGVLSITSERAPAAPFAQGFLVQGGSFGMFKAQSRTAVRQGAFSATASLSYLSWEGPRQWSDTDQRALNLGFEYLLSGNTVLTGRVNAAAWPLSRNAGALTAREWARNPDSAAANNILRASNEDTDQQQAGFALKHTTDAGEQWEASVFAWRRSVDNALATPSTVQPGPTVGQFTEFRRTTAGVRLSGQKRLRPSDSAPLVTFGLDAQLSRDTRLNLRSLAGVPSTPRTVLLDQDEDVDQLAPFAQVAWRPDARWQFQAGGRYDRLTFRATDRVLTDGDNGGARTLASWSGNAGASYVVSDAFVPYANLSTSFETPTTTELAIRADLLGGFNPDLQPQRSVNLEFGARGLLGRAAQLSWTATAFRVWIRDAIVQFQNIDQRNFFTNAGRVQNQGLELGLQFRPVERLQFNVAYTYADYQFTDYKVRRGAVVDTLDGRVLPGIPKHFLRLELRTRIADQLRLDVDQTISSSIFTDDRNTATPCAQAATAPTAAACVVDGWATTNLRLTWSGTRGDARVQPFLGIYNAFNTLYVPSVIINGGFGRILEPAPRRNFYAGMQVNYR